MLPSSYKLTILPSKNPIELSIGSPFKESTNWNINNISLIKIVLFVCSSLAFEYIILGFLYFKYSFIEIKEKIIEMKIIIIEIKDEKRFLYRWALKINNWGVTPIKSKLYKNDWNIYRAFLLLIIFLKLYLF